MNIKSNKLIKNYKKIAFYILWGIYVSVFIYLIYFIDKHVDQYLDSDMSSEMILGNILNQEGKILTTSWKYTTELRVLNTNLLYSLSFYLSDNWHVVRIITSILCYLVTALCLYYFCSKVDLKNYYPLIGICFFVPFSNEYMEYFLYGLYYFPHICISLVSLGMICHTNLIENEKKRNILLILNFILAFFAGMGGLRQLIILYLPLFITFANITVKDKKIYNLVHSVIIFFGAGLGYIINILVLSKKYYVMNWGNDISFEDFNPEGLLNVIRGFFRCMGYGKGAVFSNTLICNSLCGIICLLLLYTIYSYHKGRDEYSLNEKIVLIYFCSSLIVFAAIYVFTDFWYSDRYNLPILLFSFPILMIGLKKLKMLLKIVIVISLTFIIIMSGKNRFGTYKYLDKTSNKIDITNYLINNGYYNGYSEMDNSFTELSGGQIDIYGWNGGEPENLYNIDLLNDAEQKTNHFSEKPKGKVFIIICKESYQVWPLSSEELFDNLIFENDDYYVFGFKNYQNMKEKIYSLQ